MHRRVPDSAPAEAYERFQTPSAAHFTPFGHVETSQERGNSATSISMLQDSPMSEAPILGRSRRVSSSTAVIDLHAPHTESSVAIAVHSDEQHQLNMSRRVARINSSDLPLLSASRLARATKRMDLQELHHLRDWLAKTSLHDAIHSGDFGGSARKWSIPPSERATMEPLAMSHLSDAQPPSRRKAGAFFNASMSHVHPNEMSRYATRDSERPTMLTATGRMAHESVAVLIDAVRGSTMQASDKCKFLFELFDVDKKGFLSRDGVTDFIEATFLASNLRVYGDIQINDIVSKLFRHTANPQKMTYVEFCAAFNSVLDSVEPTSLFQTSEENLDALLTSRVDTAASKTAKLFPKSPLLRKAVAYRRHLVRQCLKHDAEILYLSAYLVILVAAFIIKAHYISVDPAVGYAPKIAKGFAQIVMVNTLFLLLPMCRNFVTFLRRFAAVSSRVPLDQHIEFHKICGVVMLVASLGHTFAWVMIVYYLRTAPHEIWGESHYAHLEFVREQSIFSLLPRIPIWTGVVMVLIGTIAAPLTLTRVRRGNFNLFWMTHLLFVPFLVLIIIHGLAKWVQPPQAYFWVLPPLILYAIERRYRVTNIFGGRTKITRVKFSQGTAAIYMEKPEDFHYHPGMYLFLNVPAVSRFEWHPFTISSAPEDDYISIHVRNAGDWTNALHETLRDVQESNASTTETDLEASRSNDVTPPRLLQDSPYPPVFIDGPMGAPAQDYYRYESVVFVGAGIGVTPFASILQSIVHQWQAFRCDRCNNVKLPKTFKLKKIYFYWITREQEALTWFAETMNELSAMDLEGRLEIHNYFSPLKRESVIAPLNALQKLVYDSEGQDIISGLATKQITHFGRPDWKHELLRIASQQDVVGTTMKRKIGVFFCGPKPMGNQIHSECAAFNQDKERRHPTISYSFHSETF